MEQEFVVTLEAKYSACMSVARNKYVSQLERVEAWREASYLISHLSRERYKQPSLAVVDK